VGEILKELEVFGGNKARDLVVKERDEGIEKIVLSWPARFSTTRAEALGLQPDISLREIIETFAKSLEEGKS